MPRHVASPTEARGWVALGLVAVEADGRVVVLLEAGHAEAGRALLELCAGAEVAPDGQPIDLYVGQSVITAPHPRRLAVRPAAAVKAPPADVRPRKRRHDAAKFPITVRATSHVVLCMARQARLVQAKTTEARKGLDRPRARGAPLGHGLHPDKDGMAHPHGA